MRTTVDAFGTEVIVGDTVVFFTNGWYSKNHGDLQKGEVIKCTSHGATVAFGNQKVNIRSGRIYKVSNGQQRLQLGTNESITISKEEYEDLLESQKFLMELEVLGVKHWEDYELACKAMEESK